jgi:hypothetical protein
VLADEAEHEEAAAADHRVALDAARDGRRRAARASRTMLWHMLSSGRDSAAPMTAFLRLGKPAQLLGALLGGHARRMRAIGLGPFGIPVV